MYDHILWLALLATTAPAQNALFEVRGAPGENLGAEVQALDDRNGDGLPEIAVGYGYSTFVPSFRVLSGSDGSVLSDILGIPIGDVNGDGHDDRFVQGASNAFGAASGDAGPLLWSVSLDAPAVQAIPYDIGDVNGDSSEDLLVNEAHGGMFRFSVYSGRDGEVIHQRLIPFQDVSNWPAAIPVGDLDGDQVSEIAFVDDAGVHILRADGAEIASWTPPVGVMQNRWHISGGHEGADADGDGLPDLGFSGYDLIPMFSIPNKEALTMIFSALDGRPIHEAEGVAGSLQGDLDADGKADLVVWNDAGFEVHSPATGAILRRVRPTTSGWPWAPQTTVLGPEAFFLPMFGAIIGDLDGDGLGELIVGENYPAASLTPMGRVRVFPADWSDEIGTRLLPPATLCPCGTAGAGTGCPNSTGLGSTLAAFGSPSMAEAHLVLTATEVPLHSNAGLFVGTGPASPEPFGSGVKLLSGPYHRVATHTDLLDHWWDTHVWQSGPATTGLAPPFGFNLTWLAGQTYYLQAWYTDDSSPCGSGFNLTNAVQLTITP